MDKKELAKLTKKALLELSVSANISGRHQMKKADLLNAIYQIQKEELKNKKQESTEKKSSKKTSGQVSKPLKDKSMGKRVRATGTDDIVGSSKRRKYTSDLLEGEEEHAIRRAKYDTGTSEQFSDIDEDIFLPTTYLSSQIQLLVKNPYEIFVYWDLVPEDINRAREQLNKDLSELKITLRVYDVTKIDFRGDNANSYFDIYPQLADRYFIKVPRTNCDYCVEIGLKSSEGFFVPITRSNTGKTPKDFVTYGLKWKQVDLKPIKKLKEKLVRKDYIKPLITLAKTGDQIISLESAKEISDRIDKINKQARGSLRDKHEGKADEYFGSSTARDFSK